MTGEGSGGDMTGEGEWEGDMTGMRECGGDMTGEGSVGET